MYTQVRNSAILIFAISSAFFSFATDSQSEIIYPRDRIFNILACAVINLAIVYLIRHLNFRENCWRIVAYGFIFYKLIINAIKFSEYFSVFHGINSDVIIFFTLVLIIVCIWLKETSIVQMSSFFIVINFVIFILFVTLSFDKINVINLYSTSTDIRLDINKFIFFDEIIIINLLFENSIKRIKYGVKFLLSTVSIIAFFTLLQGFCIKGNVLYSILPLQSLMQIFSGNTIKRYDYILSLLQSFNYYAAIIFLMWGFTNIKTRKGELYNEKN